MYMSRQLYQGIELNLLNHYNFRTGVNGSVLHLLLLQAFCRCLIVLICGIGLAQQACRSTAPGEQLPLGLDEVPVLDAAIVFHFYELLHLHNTPALYL